MAQILRMANETLVSSFTTVERSSSMEHQEGVLLGGLTWAPPDDTGDAERARGTANSCTICNRQAALLHEVTAEVKEVHIDEVEKHRVRQLVAAGWV